MDTLRGLFSDLLYLRQFIISCSGFLLFLICTALYASRLKRKAHFVPRLVLSLLLCLLWYGGLAALRAYGSLLLGMLLTNISNFCLPLLLLIICFDEPLYIDLLCWCAINATLQAGTSVFNLFFALTGKDGQATMSFFRDFVPLRDWGIYLAIHIALFVLCYLIFGKWDQLTEDEQLVKSVTALSVFSAVALAILSTFTAEFQSESRGLYMVGTFYSLFLSIFILFQRTYILSLRKHRQEISVMEQVMQREMKQYEAMKQNIDLINMKCHDLKHQLDHLQGKLTEQEVASLQQAIRIYDHNIRTGCETLDVILCEKQLVCESRHITLTCMADGRQLNFMSVSHIYSLFNNAIDNAIDAVVQVADPEKWIIDISIRHTDGVEVEIANYFNAANASGNVKPISTTKRDMNHHGFGIASMSYITSQYGGTLSTEIDGDMFILKIQFPAQALHKELQTEVE